MAKFQPEVIWDRKEPAKGRMLDEVGEEDHSGVGLWEQDKGGELRRG